MDLWVNLGAIGLALFSVAYLTIARGAFRFYRTHSDKLGAWPLAFMAFLFLYNLTEVTEMEQNSIFMMLLAAVAAVVTLRSFEPEAEEVEYLPTFDRDSDPVCLSQ